MGLLRTGMVDQKTGDTKWGAEIGEDVISKEVDWAQCQPRTQY